MLILKGDKGKSKFLYNLMGNNLCFEYCDYSVNLGGYWLSSLHHTIEGFKNYIEACLYKEDIHCMDNFCEYLIIYTNEKEEDLKDFISWLKDNERWFLCRDILIVCK